MGKDRPQVGWVAVDREVEGDPGGGRQLGDLVLEHAAVAGVDEVERARVGEVVRVEPEPRHADVAADEDAVALDQRHVGKGVRALETRTRLTSMPSARNPPSTTSPARSVPTVPRYAAWAPARPGGHGDVQGVAAREHAPEVTVAVDDVVAGAEDPHLSTRP